MLHPTARRFSSALRLAAAPSLLPLLFLGLCAAPPAAAQIPTVFADTDTTALGITDTRDAFRTAIGGGVVAGPNGSFGGVRREINWDAAPDAVSAPNAFPGTFFVNPRGANFTTPGTGFQLSMDNDVPPDADPDQLDYSNINPGYLTTFEPFSVQRLFTALGSTITDVTFAAPGTGGTTFATTSAFGAVFSDVDLTGPTTMEFFTASNTSLGLFTVPGTVGQETFSFLGVEFNDGGGNPVAVVARVRIVSGNNILGPNTGDFPNDPEFPSDLVTMDDFIYAEPLGAPEPGTALLALGALPIALGIVIRRRRR